jgi:hypothetical protein
MLARQALCCLSHSPKPSTKTFECRRSFKAVSLGGEMTQTLYVHMNKKNNNKINKAVSFDMLLKISLAPVRGTGAIRAALAEGLV